MPEVRAIAAYQLTQLGKQLATRTGGDAGTMAHRRAARRATSRASSTAMTIRRARTRFPVIILPWP